jgi:TolB-like protein/DNA-binding winged helix-turn-helix (wHTH) protein
MMSERSATAETFKVGDWSVEPAANRLFCVDREIRVEPKVMRVLAYLIERRGEVVSRHDLEANVWTGLVVTDDAVTNTVIKLRKALGDNARDPRYIETIAKSGYRLIAEVEPFSHTSSGQAGADAEPSMPDIELRPTAPVIGRPTTAVVAVAVLLAAVIGSWLVVQLPENSRLENQPVDSTLPMILVLPFEDLSNDSQYESFADGITEDIITDLSGLSNLLVISSNTSFAFKDKQAIPQELASELNVDFVLDGSIRRHGDTVRVNAQLVDASTGLHKWAERYDDRVTEVFAVQDKLTKSIVDALAVRLSKREAANLASRRTNNLVAYDHFQEGLRLARSGDRDAIVEAMAAYRKATAADPDYGRVYGALGYALALNYTRGWTNNPQETIDRALELARTAVDLNSSVPQTHWALAYVRLMRKEYEQAAAAATKAVTITPNYADGYGLLSMVKIAQGEPKQAIALLEKGIDLNPYYTWDYPYNLGRAHYALGRYQEAVALFEDARTRNMHIIQIRLHLAASYARVGRQDDAEWEVEEIKSMSPTDTISHLKSTYPMEDVELFERLVEDLRRAGLPER